MDYQEKEFLISKMLARYYQIDGVKIAKPSTESMYDANIFYNKVYSNSLSDGIPTQQDMVSVLYNEGLWNDYKEKLFTSEIGHRIEDLKVLLYQNVWDTQEVARLNNDLSNVRNQAEILTNEKYMYYQYTCEGIANYAKSLYLIEKYNKSSRSTAFLHHQLNQDVISEVDLRELARSDPWCSYYNFNYTKPKFWSDDLRKLCQWTRFYQSIYKSGESPNETVISNDDMIDGWSIHRRRESDKNARQNMVESKISNEKIRNSSERFVVAKTRQEAQEIYATNSAPAKQIIQQVMDKSITGK